MASISIDKDTVTLTLAPWEKITGLVGNLRVPRSAITSATAVDSGFRALRGMRVGLGIPFVRAIGRWVGFGYKDWVSVAPGPALVLELDGQRFDRAIVSAANATELAASLS